MLTNCKNCGAPLKLNKCEYCGTEYIDDYQRTLAQIRLEELQQQQKDLAFKIAQDKINTEILKYVCMPTGSFK